MREGANKHKARMATQTTSYTVEQVVLGAAMLVAGVLFALQLAVEFRVKKHAVFMQSMFV